MRLVYSAGSRAGRFLTRSRSGREEFTPELTAVPVSLLQVPTGISSPYLARRAAGDPERLRSARRANPRADDLDGDVRVGPPGCVHGERSRPGASAKPGTDTLTVEKQGARGTVHVGRPGATGEERPMGNAHRRHVERSAEMEGETGTARMISAGRVHEQHVRQDRERRRRPREQRPLAQREAAGLVGGGSLATDHDHVVIQGGGGPASIARLAWPVPATLEADEAAADTGTRGGSPGLRGRGRQSKLQRPELLGRGRPRDHLRIVTTAACSGCSG